MLRLEAAAADAVYVDAYHGVLLQPTLVDRPATGGNDDASPSTQLELSFQIEAHGFGAVVELRGVRAPPVALTSLMSRMRRLSRVPLARFDATWRPLPQSMEPVASSTPPAAADLKPPEDMVAVPREVAWRFDVAGVEVEGGCDPANDPNGVCCTGDCSRWVGPGPPQLINCQCGMEAEDDAGNDVMFPWEVRRYSLTIRARRTIHGVTTRRCSTSAPFGSIAPP